MAYLEAADSSKERFSRSALSCALVYPLLHRGIELSPKTPTIGEIHRLSMALVEDALVDSFPRFTRRLVQEIVFSLESQYRFTPVSKRPMKSMRFLTNSDIHFALDFLKLRSLVEEDLEETFKEWSAKAPEKKSRPQKRRRPRRRRR